MSVYEGIPLKGRAYLLWKELSKEKTFPDLREAYKHAIFLASKCLEYGNFKVDEYGNVIDEEQKNESQG